MKIENLLSTHGFKTKNDCFEYIIEKTRQDKPLFANLIFKKLDKNGKSDFMKYCRHYVDDIDIVDFFYDYFVINEE